MLNKKGDLPTVMLALVALVLTTVTLYTFASFNDNFISNSKLTTTMLLDVDFNQQYVLTETKLIVKETIKNCETCEIVQLKEKFKESAKWREELFFISELGNFYGQIRNDKFEIENQSKNYKLQIPALFLISEIDMNKVKRNFEICMIFDSNGEFLKECDE